MKLSQPHEVQQSRSAIKHVTKQWLVSNKLLNGGFLQSHVCGNCLGSVRSDLLDESKMHAAWLSNRRGGFQTQTSRHLFAWKVGLQVLEPGPNDHLDTSWHM
jgi:hypothetical protein